MSSLKKVEKIYPLTYMQEAMLLSKIVDKESSAYYEINTCNLKGDLDIDILNKSLKKLIEKYEVFRTTFAYENLKRPVQIVLKERACDIDYLDISNIENDKKEQFIKDYIERNKKKGFDLTKDILIKFSVIKLNMNEYKIIICNHHIIMDGWCLELIFNDILNIYHKIKCGINEEVTNNYPYYSYVEWLDKQDMSKAKEYWDGYLSNYLPISTIPFKNNNNLSSGNYSQKEIEFVIDKNLTIELESIAKKNNTTINIIMQSIWSILLYKYNNVGDVLFSYVVSGRNHEVPGIESMVGLFINTIPVRIKIENDITYKELIKKINKNFFESMRYDYYPIRESISKENLPDSIMIFDNFQLNSNYLKEDIDNNIEIYNFNVKEETDYDFNIKISHTNNIKIKFSFNDCVYQEEDIKRVKNHFINIINEIKRNPEIKVKDIEVLDKKEQQKILFEFNTTRTNYPNKNTIHQLFQEQVENSPNRIAIQYLNDILTYDQLNKYSNKLANILKQEYGVSCGDVVAINFDRSIEMIIGILATLKAGAVCLPIEINLPISRSIDMIVNSNAKVVLNNKNLSYDGFQGKVMNFVYKELDIRNVNNILNCANAEDLAYLIYTSGSTGTPKAVRITHKGIINHAFMKIKEVGITEKDICCHNLSFNFVASIWLIFSPLFVGGKIHLYNDEITADTCKLLKRVEEDRISILEIVPSVMSLFLELPSKILDDISMKYLRKIILTGEEVKPTLVNKFYKRYRVHLVNAYGQSECSDDTIHYHIPYSVEVREVPIGKPGNNIEAFILDDDNKITPIGVQGQLCISGDGVAKGYLNSQILTNEKFIQNPYNSGNILYKTGDIAKWLPNGNIVFCGRIDQQVKIRGVRIELGEIESNMICIEGISEVAVVQKGIDDISLCAYYVSSKEYNSSQLRQKLRINMPNYMIPARFVRLDRMPLNNNGKIDRRYLSKLKEDILCEKSYEPPQNNTEIKLTELWKEILRIDNVGIFDNFFDLGGHSLKAVALIARINKEFNIEIPLRLMLEGSTIHEVNEYIKFSQTKFHEEITRVGEQDFYEVSSAQKRMFIEQEIEKSSITYNIPILLEINGKIDFERIRLTILELVEKHEALRTNFELTENGIIQKICNMEDLRFDIEEIEINSTTNIEEDLRSFIRPFNLSKAPLLRVGIAKLEEEKSIIVFDVHHIVSDGVSIQILVKEFMSIYSGIEKSQMKIQYKDYVIWHNKKQLSKEYKKQEEYWLSTFKEKVSALNLPTDYSRPLKPTFNGDEINFKLNNEEIYKLRQIARESNTTMYTVLLSGFNILLSKYTGSRDIIVGTPVAGRNHVDLNNIIGMFVNNLVIKSDVNPKVSYKEYLNQLKNTMIDAYENQEYQYDQLVEKVEFDREFCNSSIFNVMFIMQNMNHTKLHIEGVNVREYELKNNKAKFDLTLTAFEENDKIFFTLNFATELYKKETIYRMIEHYKNIMRSIINDKDKNISEIELLTEEEKNEILYEFNDTNVDYFKDKTLQELFEEQVERTPNNVALVFDNKSLTYKELNEKANQVANILREAGVKPDNSVGIIVERSLYMIIGIMGILKSGGAYLPIDPKTPKARISYMLSNSNTKLLLTQKHLHESIIEYEDKIINVDELKNLKVCNNLEEISSANNLAYVMYTSGTTGKPKGVMIEHKQVNNFINGIIYKTNINKYSSILNITTMSFDIFGLETLLPLTNGMKVVMTEDDDATEVSRINKLILENEIEVIQTTPSRMKLFMEDSNFQESLQKLKLVLVGGEEMSSNLAEELIKFDNLKIYNMYGPTETTIWSAVKLVENQDITIGNPIQNTKIYILDKNLRLQAIGMPGELCISGDGVARGYINNEELTKEKFIDNPYVQDEKLYKTGDLAKWLPNGEIEFLGRIDDQVKIRGFRIELGEIESALLSIDVIKEAVVIEKKDNFANKYLCAYLVSDKELTVSELRKYLSVKLLDYMIPSFFMYLKKLPLNQNGKIDRKVLPKLQDEVNTGVKYKAPRNEIEEKLSILWSEVLGVEKVGINDNFFELGGHSLKATILVSKIHQEFSIKVSIRELFKSLTIRGISEYISSKEKVIYKGIKKADKKLYYPVTQNQKGLFIANKNAHYKAESNIPLIINIEGSVDKDKLQKVLIELINRHEAFRTSFHIIDEEVVCMVHEDMEFKLKYEEHIGRDINEYINVFIKHFDLDSYPLMRALLIKTKEEKYTLLIDIHHIVVDGYSLNILYKELVYLYMNEKLESKEYDLVDYLVNESELIRDEKIKEMEQYWKSNFSDDVKPLQIPYDFKGDVYKGETVQATIQSNIVNKLTEIANSEKTTLHTVIFSLYVLLLNQYSEQNEIVIGSISAGRRLPEYKDIIGSFINIIPIINRIDKDTIFTEFLNKTNENLIAAYENQYFPFHKLQIDKLINTLVNFHTEIEKNEKLQVEGLKFEFYDDFKNNQANMDIQVDFIIMDSGELKCLFEYNVNKFKEETIKRMTKHFMYIINQVVKDTSLKIKNLKTLSIAEERHITNDFNNTFINYDKSNTIYRMFEKQVEKTPDSIAIEYYNEKITYMELNKKANALARKLCNFGVKAESIVGIKVDRSIEMMIGLFAIFKAGGAYLPIDTEYPIERSKFMIEDSGTKIILTQKKFLKSSDIKEFTGIVVDLNNDELYKGDNSNLEVNNKLNNLAYIIYTSGSTGKPKGVMVEHGNIVAYINAFSHEYNIDNKDVILQQASYGFDTSVEELYPILTVGGKLVIASRSDVKDITKLMTLINKYKITIISASPLLIYAMNQENLSESVRLVISGGDILKKEYISNIIKYSEVYNTYGPTESTVCATYYKCSKNLEDNIPIGKPIANYSVYIVNKVGKIQPIGLPGELCVSGPGVTRGYLNNEELTKERFIENSFINGQRMYRTGDLARWLSNGNIEYLGRIDNQIKIRGYRVELCEIEQVILKDKNIKDVVVIYSDDKYICAYIVGNVKINTKELKRNLYKEIPRYMVPQFIMQIDKMPESINGKLDNSKLPIPEFRRSENDDYLEPRNDIESKLCELFSEMLKINNISINDDLFDLGLDSLKLILVLPKIQKEFNVKLFVEDVFNNTTIKSLYEKIITADKEKYIAISKTEYSEYYPTSSAQKRLYMINQLDSNNTNYNIPIAIKIYEVLDIDKVKNIFTELINRHEILRTRFEFKNDELVQIIDNKIDFQVEYVEVDKENFELEDFQKSFIKPFDLQKGPLIRVKIIKLSIDEFILQIDIHHIIADGHSIGILVNEFSRLYLGEKLSDVNLQYKDFVVWEQRMIKEGSFKEQEKYWSDMYKNSITKLEMPLDYERPDIQSFQGNKISFEIEEELLGKVKRVCSETGSTINILLFTAYATLLGLYTNNEDLVIGVPVLGRSHSDLQNVVGMFVNTLAIRVFPKRNKTFKGFLYEVKDTLMKSYEYQNFPLDKLIENLNWDRTSNENPLFDTIFNFRSNLNDEPVLENLKIEYIESNNKTAKFDFYLDVYQSKEKVYFDLEYCTELFDKETIDMLVEFYLKVINTICDDMDIYLNEIELEDENSCFGEVDFNF
ncbi:amino acid adenylation domain-containing protein [Clostridium botulinum]|nr:amino acid adenylation domain-containing protein [Clostridium botulinum]